MIKMRMLRSYQLLREESGFALILAVFLILFISLLFVGLFNLLSTDLQITCNHQNDAITFYIAEAGIEDAIDNLRQNGAGWSHGTYVVLFPAGSQNTYTVTYPYDDPGTAGIVEALIRSVGTTSGGVSRTIHADPTVSGTAVPYTVEIVSWEVIQ